jgi:hypothetical protein
MIMSEAPSMKVQQRLASGTIIVQDFRTSVRFPIFETSYAEWLYATNGGTLFLVAFCGQVFGLTCCHVLNGFEWPRLRITEAKFGKMFAPIQSLVYPSSPKGDAVDTDILDIAVVEFAPEVTPTFFPDPPYVLDAGTCGTANIGDVLYVNGALKENPISPRCRSPRRSASSNLPIWARPLLIRAFARRTRDSQTPSSRRSPGSVQVLFST